MYESMRNQCTNFHLFIFPFDSLSLEILQNLKLESVTIIPLDQFETAELKEVKKSRTTAEYCWTCTPSIVSYILKNYDVPHCTYVDADLYFYSDPSVLVSEMEKNNKSVLITEHRFSVLPKLYEEKRAGRFCVQFITFLKEEKSIEVLERWRKQCLDWCYARYEDGKFGDQKYLDNWPMTYSNVHILQHEGGGIAPWNLTQYSFSEDKNSIKGKVRKSKVEFRVVFFHFQYVKLLKDGSFDIGWYYISPVIIRMLYWPYFKMLNDIEQRILHLNASYKRGITSFNTDNIKNKMKTAFKRVFGYNIFKYKD
jgi:hypothetical protein